LNADASSVPDGHQTSESLQASDAKHPLTSWADDTRNGLLTGYLAAVAPFKSLVGPAHSFSRWHEEQSRQASAKSPELAEAFVNQQAFINDVVGWASENVGDHVAIRTAAAALATLGSYPTTPRTLAYNVSKLVPMGATIAAGGMAGHAVGAAVHAPAFGSAGVKNVLDVVGKVAASALINGHASYQKVRNKLNGISIDELRADEGFRLLESELGSAEQAKEQYVEHWAMFAGSSSMAVASTGGALPLIHGFSTAPIPDVIRNTLMGMGFQLGENVVRDRSTPAASVVHHRIGQRGTLHALNTTVRESMHTPLADMLIDVMDI
jgi:hypothetical protein